MDKLLTVILITALCMTTGCANIKIVHDDITAEYTRWGNQSLEGFCLRAPDDWEMCFDKQESDVELGFRLGAVGVQVGGGG